MKREQTYKYLYIPAFFSLMALIHTVTIYRTVYLLFDQSPVYVILMILFMIILTLSPIVKSNKILFLAPIHAFFIFPESIITVYDYFFSSNIIIPKIGFLPALWAPLAVALMDISGLIILGLRCYGYIQEHRLGRKTEF